MEFYRIAYRFLRKSGLNVSQRFIQQRMRSHPNYPTLVSLTDTLDELGIEYSAASAEKGSYRELSYPLLANVSRDRMETMTLVNHVNQFEADNGELFNGWNGIFITITTGAQMSSKLHAHQRQKERREELFIGVVISGLLACFSYYLFSLPIFSHFILSILGIVASGLVVMKGLGLKNVVLDKVCPTTGEKDACGSNNETGAFKNFPFGPVGCIYFLVMALFALPAVGFANEIAAYFFVLGIGGGLFAVFSLLYQGMIRKSWCRLCVAVDAILLLQLGIASYINSSVVSLNMLIVGFLGGFFLVSVFLSCLFWFIWNTAMEQKGSALHYEIGFMQWKRHPDVFNAILVNEKHVDTSRLSDINVIHMGNRNTGIQITLVCAPYCKPCAEAHKEMHALLETFPNDIGINVRFVVNDPSITNADSLAIAHIVDSVRQYQDASTVLDTWFSTMNLQRFLEAYPPEHDLMDEYERWLISYKRWNDEYGITETPSVFIDGYALPKQYRIRDLKLLIPQLSENIADHSSPVGDVMDA